MIRLACGTTPASEVTSHPVHQSRDARTIATMNAPAGHNPDRFVMCRHERRLMVRKFQYVARATSTPSSIDSTNSTT